MAASASNLSADLIHEILTQSPDFGTLFAAIRISKTYLTVFKAHPKSILHAVTENVAGPAMPPAARLAQYGDDNDLDSLPDEAHYLSVDWMVTRPIPERLEKQANAVRVLRNFYSLRNKDRTSQSSKLNSDEVMRFDRAMYRSWLYFDMIGNDAFVRGEDEDKVDEENDDEDLAEQQRRAGLTKLTASFSPDELFELVNVSRFCRQTQRWQAYGAPDLTYAHTCDPITLANNLDSSHSVNNPPYGVAWRSIGDMVSGILLLRNFKEKDIEDKINSAIVKTVIGAQDACSRCNAVVGVDLVGTPNISLLSGTLPLVERIALLPGLLCRNYTEQVALINPLNVDNRISEEDLFHELVDIVPDDDDSMALEPHQWSKDDWYCLACIKELYRQRFMVWWRDAKAKSGAPHRDDCWYGYNCRTMTHNPLHAEKLNHLCKPTRGEAPQAQGQAVPLPTAPN